MKIGAIVQARISSTRVPRKILKELPYDSGVTALEQVIRRIKRSKKLDEIIIATTADKEDEEIVKIAEKERVKCFSGSRDDVLDRYYLSAKKHNLDVIVRVTSDCPCMDAHVVDSAIERHVSGNADYTSNIQVRTFPHGMDVEVFNFAAIQKAHNKAKKWFEREHVCPYIYKTNPHMFKISTLEATKELYAPDIRITLDVEADYALLCAVFDYLYVEDEFFGVEKILKLFNEKPWLKLINKKVHQKKIFETLEEELEEAVKTLDMQDLKQAKDFIKRQLNRGL